MELIRKHEGLRLRAYRCPAGTWTIGYGHTAGVMPGDVITPEEAERLLRDDVAAIGAQVDSLAREVGVTLPPNRREALVSFAFNVGFDALRRSTLWKKIARNPDDPAIADEFARWKYAGGKVMPGLVNRRHDECDLYFSNRE